MKKSAVKRVLFSLAYALFASAPAFTWALVTEGDEVQLSPMVTTATKTPRRLDEVPVQTIVLTRAEIEKTHAQNLAEALKYAPGVQLKPIHGKTGQGAWIQGFDADRVLILINGNPISPSTGSTIDVTQVAIGDIEQIEIIKGATSALYGTSAMGGVINVITREPESDFLISADLSGGNWGNQSEESNPFAKRHGNFEIATRQENWHGQVVAALTESDGFKAPNTEGESTQGWRGYKHTLSSNFQYRFNNDLKITVMPRYFDEDISVLNNRFAPGIGNLTEEYTDKTLVKNISTVIEQSLFNNGHWKVRAMWEDYYNDANKASHRETTSNHSEFSGQLDLSLGTSHIITLGAEYQFDAMNVENISSNIQEVSDETKTSIQLFMQDSWFLSPNLELLPGTRIHNDSRFGSHLAPMLNAMYNTEELFSGRFNFRAGIGNGYRTPNLKELFYIFDHSEIGYIVQGNEDLEPESSTSYQLGAEWIFPKDDGSLTISVFHNDIDKLITEVLNPNEIGQNNATVYEYQNVEQAMTQGFELSFSKQFRKYFTFDMSYNYLNARDKKTNKILVERPETSIKVGLDIFLSKLMSLTNKINYESDQYLDEANTIISPGYSVWDSALNYDVSSQWKLYGGVNNVTNVQRVFDGTDFRPVAGRYVYLGFSYQYEH